MPVGGPSRCRLKIRPHEIFGMASARQSAYQAPDGFSLRWVSEPRGLNLVRDQLQVVRVTPPRDLPVSVDIER